MKKQNSKNSNTVRTAKKAIIATVGITLCLIGFILFFLPGPGFIIIILGLVVLAGEFVWARRLLEKVQSKIPKTLRKKN